MWNAAGEKVCSSSSCRDPLGPPFNINLVWVQRMLPIAQATKNAGEEEVSAYRETMRQRNLNALAIGQLAALQQGRALQRQEPGNQNPITPYRV